MRERVRRGAALRSLAARRNSEANRGAHTILCTDRLQAACFTLHLLPQTPFIPPSFPLHSGSHYLLRRTSAAAMPSTLSSAAPCTHLPYIHNRFPFNFSRSGRIKLSQLLLSLLVTEPKYSYIQGMDSLAAVCLKLFYASPPRALLLLRSGSLPKHISSTLYPSAALTNSTQGRHRPLPGQGRV